MSRKTTVRALATACVLALALAPATVSAPKRLAVTCGQTITVNTLVSNDLVNCAFDGLRIGANGITLDLGGHTIDGLVNTNSRGVVNSGFDNVTVQNGTVTQFETGVSLIAGANLNTISALRAYANTTGLGIFDSANATITGSTIAGSGGNGVLLIRSPRSRFLSSTASGNAGIGVNVFDSPDTLVSGVKAISNNRYGIVISETSPRSEVRNSVASSNDLSGIAATAPTAKLTGNTTLFNTQLGIDAFAGVTDGGGNKAHDNGNQHQCENVVCL
jgi:Right handed beta helix region